MGIYTENGTYRFFKIALSAILCVKIRFGRGDKIAISAIF